MIARDNAKMISDPGVGGNDSGLPTNLELEQIAKSTSDVLQNLAGDKITHFYNLEMEGGVWQPLQYVSQRGDRFYNVDWFNRPPIHPERIADLLALPTPIEAMPGKTLWLNPDDAIVYINGIDPFADSAPDIVAPDYRICFCPYDSDWGQKLLTQASLSPMTIQDELELVRVLGHELNELQTSGSSPSSNEDKRFKLFLTKLSELAEKHHLPTLELSNYQNIFEVVQAFEVTLAPKL
jgi:hypothetical protein